jgi:hypothetical protein
MHVARVVPFWQTVPLCVQTDAMQVQAEAVPDPVQDWCAPQVVESTHWVQPVACMVHV